MDSIYKQIYNQTSCFTFEKETGCYVCVSTCALPKEACPKDVIVYPRPAIELRPPRPPRVRRTRHQLFNHVVDVQPETANPETSNSEEETANPETSNPEISNSEETAKEETAKEEASKEEASKETLADAANIETQIGREATDSADTEEQTEREEKERDISPEDSPRSRYASDGDDDDDIYSYYTPQAPPEDDETTTYVNICNKCFKQQYEKPLLEYESSQQSTTSSVLLLDRIKVFPNTPCAYRHYQGRDTLSTSYEDDDIILYFLSSINSTPKDEYSPSHHCIRSYSLTTEKVETVFRTNSTCLASAHGFIVFSDTETLVVYHVATKQTLFKKKIASEFLTGQIVYRGSIEDAVYAAVSSNDGDVLFYRVVDTGMDSSEESKNEVMTLLCRLHHPFAINCPSISPDGNWMSCVTDERGLVFIYELEKIKTRGARDPVLISDYWTKSNRRTHIDPDNEDYEAERKRLQEELGKEEADKNPTEHKRKEDNKEDEIIKVLRPRRVFFNTEDTGNSAMSSSWSPDSRYLAVADEGGEVVVYDMSETHTNTDTNTNTDSWRPPIAWSKGFGSAVRKIAFAPSLDVHVLCFISGSAAYFVDTRSWAMQAYVFIQGYHPLHGYDRHSVKNISGVAWTKNGNKVYVGTSAGIYEFPIAVSKVGVQSLVDCCIEVIGRSGRDMAEKHNWAERILMLPDEIRQKLKFK